MVQIETKYFVLHGGNTYELTPEEFDYIKLFNDGYDSRETTEEEQQDRLAEIIASR